MYHIVNNCTSSQRFELIIVFWTSNYPIFLSFSPNTFPSFSLPYPNPPNYLLYSPHSPPTLNLEPSFVFSLFSLLQVLEKHTWFEFTVITMSFSVLSLSHFSTTSLPTLLSPKHWSRAELEWWSRITTTNYLSSPLSDDQLAGWLMYKD